MAHDLVIRDVSKQYVVDGARREVLAHINIDVAAGEFVSILGPSGCGKSTLLRLIIGLDDDYQGQIELGGRRVSGSGLERGIVFQDHRLLPWLTLEQTISLALENVNWTARKKRTTVREHIALVGLTGYEKSYPHQLSGGMAQRAAIARGLVTQPDVLLLDEPLGALDALTRVRLQEELLRIWRAEPVSMIMVTHDIEEAIYLSKRIVVLQAHPGRVSKIIDVDLPWPRDRADYAFSDLRREVISAMGDEFVSTTPEAFATSP